MWLGLRFSVPGAWYAVLHVDGFFLLFSRFVFHRFFLLFSISLFICWFLFFVAFCAGVSFRLRRFPIYWVDRLRRTSERANEKIKSEPPYNVIHPWSRQLLLIDVMRRLGDFYIFGFGFLFASLLLFFIFFFLFWMKAVRWGLYYIRAHCSPCYPFLILFAGVWRNARAQLIWA